MRQQTIEQAAEDTVDRLAITLRRVRQSRGLTQAELAEAIGFTRQSIIAFEAGRVPNVSARLIIAAAAACGLTFAEFVELAAGS